MNTGTSGSVSSITPAESGSSDRDEDEHRDRDVTASTTCGR